MTGSDATCNVEAPGCGFPQVEAGHAHKSLKARIIDRHGYKRLKRSVDLAVQIGT